MGNHRKTRAARTPSKLNRTCAICAIAGAAGFGLISLAPTAFADNSSDDGWWLGSGNNTPSATTATATPAKTAPSTATS